MKEVKKKPPPKCYTCSDTGNVRRGFVEPYLGYQAGREWVKCPKCNKK